MTRPPSKFKKFRRRLRDSFGYDISTPSARRKTVWHYHLFDHAFFRTFWTNFAEVAPGVYRSNHPSPKMLEKYKTLGIKTVLNLRGNDQHSAWILESDTCERLDLDLRVSKIYPRRTAEREELLTLIDTLRTLPKPFLMHCKSGADRAGFASALYLAVVANVPVAEAKKQLSARFLHFGFTSTGILDHIFEVYEARAAQSPISMEEWIATEYDRHALQTSFDTQRART